MRYPVLILLSLCLFACGKTGALYLPEEQQPPVQQEEQVPKQDGGNEGKTD